jgi:hypothetical protein
MTPRTIIIPQPAAATSFRCASFLSATSLTFLKPRFKRFLMSLSDN